MKTIVYFFIASLIFMTCGFMSPPNSKNVILKASGVNVNAEQLKQASGIISARLKVYGVESSVAVNADKKQITVQLPDNINVAEIEGLLISKGNLGFYEGSVVAGGSLLTRTDIETITSSKSTDSQSVIIGIRFKPSSVKRWAETTRKCLGKPIAIAIDNKVYYTPVVKTVIENGLCEITGSMTQTEVNYFLALVNNEPLPVTLSLN